MVNNVLSFWESLLWYIRIEYVSKHFYINVNATMITYICEWLVNSEKVTDAQISYPTPPPVEKEDGEKKQKARAEWMWKSQEVGCTLIGEDRLVVMAGAEQVEW